ncbi:MAG: methyltransferase domain-containing protein [Candidatus Omnitrophota bacterium]
MPNLPKKILRELGAVVSHRTWGTTTARYCYSIWLRHLLLARKRGMPVPMAVAEFGPGDSLGIGLAALLTGAEKYYAFDIAEYSLQKRNLRILDELVELFERREDIVEEKDFERASVLLDLRRFPRDVLSDEHMSQCLRKERIEAIRGALINLNRKMGEAIEISYCSRWNERGAVKENTVDMVYSQAVMEHVDDLRSAYGTMRRLLKKGGFMSHQIDFKCHGTSLKWNGHWKHNDAAWKMIRFLQRTLIPVRLINREPYSTHKKLIEEAGFTIVCDIPIRDTSGAGRGELADRFKDLGGEDLSTSGAFIQAVKR